MQFERKPFTEAIAIIAGIAGIAVSSGSKRTKSTLTSARNSNPAPKHYDIIPPSFLLETPQPCVTTHPLTSQLSNVFGEDIVRDVLHEYKITMEGNWITFPQIDYKGNYRTGKSVFYKEDGHRADNPKPRWVHNELKRKGLLPHNFTYKQCFTGEHIIQIHPDKAIGIVEGQSTMLFMAALSRAVEQLGIQQLKSFTNFIWISTGGSDGVGWKDAQVVSALKGREVLLFPDAGFYGQWLYDSEILQEYGIKVEVSDLIESKYREGMLQHNEDLRDYFIQYAGEIKQICNPKPIQVPC